MSKPIPLNINPIVSPTIPTTFKIIIHTANASNEAIIKSRSFGIILYYNNSIFCQNVNLIIKIREIQSDEKLEAS